ncbi:MAG TPA: polyketide synthase docking domain-containing protein, partial [Solirubrobacteraceae bacterium]
MRASDQGQSTVKDGVHGERRTPPATEGPATEESATEKLGISNEEKALGYLKQLTIELHATRARLK